MRLKLPSKPWLDLGALFLIWAGTATITFVGIPELGPAPFVIGITPLGQGALGVPPRKPEEVDAYVAYLRWAGLGFALITAGIWWQAVEPYRRLSQGRGI